MHEITASTVCAGPASRRPWMVLTPQVRVPRGSRTLEQADIRLPDLWQLFINHKSSAVIRSE